MTSFTCSSRQARTQRVPWMQASRFTVIAGCGMSTPWRFAAWMIVSPAKALTVSPFSLKSMVCVFPTGSFIFISDLVREVLDHAADGIRRGLPQPADRRVGHGDVQLLEQRL